jgi:hypothetical protein
MQSEESQADVAAFPGAPGGPPSGRTPISRRQAIGRMSALATAGAAAWVMPEILTAKPAAGATLSGPATSPALTAPDTPNVVSTAAASTSSQSLAYTGLNIQRDTEVGAALIAGGWALQHWASRTQKLPADGPNEAHQAGSAGGSAGGPA